MVPQARLVLKTLALSALVLLPFLAHFVFGPGGRRSGERAAVAVLISQGRYAQAYRALAGQDPEALDVTGRREAELQLAICERRLGRPARAYARLDRLRNANGPLEEYRRLWMAGCLQEMGEHQGAVTAYEDFLVTTGHAGLAERARGELAELYLEADAPDRALAAYEQLLDSSGEARLEAMHRIGRIHLMHGDESSARRWWLQMAQESPRSWRALDAMERLPESGDADELKARAAVLMEHEHFSAAIRVLRRFGRELAQHPSAPDMHYLLARAYAAAGQYERALQTYEEVFAASRLPDALFGAGTVQVRRGEDQAAIATFERFVRLFPGHALAAECLWQAAKAAERGDRFDEAEALYRGLAEKYPDSELRDEAAWSIGFMFYCREEFAGAMVVFDRLSRMAREPHIADQSLYWAGKTAERLGRADAARAYYERAAEGFPRSYYSTRAVALGHHPQPSLAIGPPPPAVDPADLAPLARGQVCLRRAEALHRVGLTDQARRELATAERMNEGSVEALRVIRDTYEAYGILDRAMRLSAALLPQGGQQEIRRIYPSYYWEQIVAAAGDAGVDPYLVLSVMRQESGFREDAVSRAGALGLMQIMPQTGRNLARDLGMGSLERHSLLDPAVSIRLGSRFLGQQVRQFAEDPGGQLGVELGLAAYNAGPHNARRWLDRIPHQDADAFVERIPFQETRHYVKLVLRNYTIYKALSDA